MTVDPNSGMVHPKCPGCGHNYFERPMQPRNPDGSYPDGGLCHWCIEEQEEEQRERDS